MEIPESLPLYLVNLYSLGGEEETLRVAGEVADR